MKFEALVGVGTAKRIEVERLEEGRFRVAGSDRAVDVEVLGAGVYSLIIDGCSYDVTVREEKKGFFVEIGPHSIPVKLQDPSQSKASVAVACVEGEATVASPMPGRVVGIKVEVGQAVKEGEGVVLVEAMKMENELHAPKEGKVKKLLVKVGDAVEAGQDLVIIE